MTDELEETLPPQSLIGIMGVPNSGKTALAWELAEKYDPRYVVIDGYAQALATEMDISLGLFATYIPNTMVAMEREKAEYKVQTAGVSTITVGTMMESIAYASLQVEQLSNREKTAEQQNKVYKEVTGAQLVALMAQDSFRYHRVFYLPLPPHIEVPGQEDKYEHWQRALDNAIVEGIDKFSINAVILTGTLEQRADKASEVLDELHRDMDEARSEREAVQVPDTE